MQNNDIDLRAMRNVDFLTVEPSTLNDIQEVQIDINLTRIKRMKQYIKQIGNPYCYKCDDIVIKIRHSNTNQTLNDRLESFISDI